MACTPALETPYAMFAEPIISDRFGHGRVFPPFLASNDPIATILPCCCRRITGSTCLQKRNVPERLIFKTLVHSSSVIDSTFPNDVIPAAVAKISIRPNRSNTSSMHRTEKSPSVTLSSKQWDSTLHPAIDSITACISVESIRAQFSP